MTSWYLVGIVLRFITEGVFEKLASNRIQVVEIYVYLSSPKTWTLFLLIFTKLVSVIGLSLYWLDYIGGWPVLLLALYQSDQLIIIRRHSFNMVRAKHYTFHHDLSSLPLIRIDFPQIWKSFLYAIMPFSSQIFPFTIFFP